MPPGDAKSGGSPDGTDFAAGRARLAINFGTVSPRCRWFNGRGPRMVITGRPATDGASRPAFRGKGGTLFPCRAAAGRDNWPDWSGFFLKIDGGARPENDATVEVHSVVRRISGKSTGDAPATRRRRPCEATRASKSGHRHASVTRQRGDSEATPMRQQPVAERPRDGVKIVRLIHAEGEIRERRNRTGREWPFSANPMQDVLSTKLP